MLIGSAYSLTWIALQKVTRRPDLFQPFPRAMSEVVLN